jgi:molecular chaperone GrpE
MSEREDKQQLHHAGEGKKRADSAADFFPDAETSAYAPEADEGQAQKLAEALGRLQAEKDELMQTMIRRQADFENYRKRVERERDDDRRRGAERVLEDLLPVLDAFDRAVKAHDNPAYEEYRKGLQIIQQQLWNMVTKHGLEKIDAAGKPFDPRFHQAIESVETTEHAEGTNIEVLQDGYLFHGRVLRPSVVRVAAAPVGAQNESIQRSSGFSH